MRVNTGINKKTRWAGLMVFLWGVFLLGPVLAADDPICDTFKYARSENGGWLNFKPQHGGTVVHDSYLSGYAWLEGVGFIKLCCDNVGPYDNTSATDWGVNRDQNGVLSGYAWSETTGWINFNPTHSQVTIDSNGWFEGYAWSEGLGYIQFTNTANGYGVRVLNGHGPTNGGGGGAGSCFISTCR